METKHIYFRSHIFLFILLPLVIIVGAVSFYRFIIKHDYVVGYEGVCDPYINKCFTGCENNECAKVYYYSKMKKYAPDLYKQCGENITDCEAASACLQGDRKCSIVYCDTEIGDSNCETIKGELLKN